jgi:crossover junction endodeoxyribonuclease RuvC
MRILGIDPGTATMGFGVLEQEGQKLRCLTYGTWRTEAGIPMEQRLLQLYSDAMECIATYEPDELSVEELFFNRNTTTAITVAQARGVILLAAAQKNLPVYEYTPLQIKMALVGYGRADKQQVQFMVRALLFLKEIPKPDDAADALAVAICRAHSRRPAIF